MTGTLTFQQHIDTTPPCRKRFAPLLDDGELWLQQGYFRVSVHRTASQIQSKDP
jgi:hypothetical protein